jgi:hypothetical protein
VAPEARSWAALGGRESMAAQAAGGGGQSRQPGSGCQRDEGEAAVSGRREPKGKT